MKMMRYLFLLVFVFQSYAQISDFDTVNFDKADRTALKYKSERLDNLPELAHKLTSNLTTDVERFRAIFTWVCHNVANDYGMYYKNMRKRQRYKTDSVKLELWNAKFRKATLKKLLDNNKTICTGYAYLLKKLANLAHIECEMVNGFAKTSTINIETLDVPNHTWNAVKLNGKWYLCDPTWASGIPDPTTFQFQFQYNDGFFLANPKLFAINHFPVDKKWLLLSDADKPSFKTFMGFPIIYGGAYAQLKSILAPKTMHNNVQKNEKVSFKFLLREPINVKEIKLLVDSGQNSKEIQPKSATIKNRTITIAHKFKHTGFYDVHVLIGKALVSTYTFKVVR